MTPGLDAATIARRPRPRADGALLVAKGAADSWGRTHAAGEPPPRKVLVLAADALVRKLVGEGLRLNGYRVLVAGSLAEAERILVDHRPDFAVLDTRLTRSSAPALAQWASTASGLAAVPTIALVGRETAEEAERTLALGYRAAVGQPVSLPRLFRTIEAVLR